MHGEHDGGEHEADDGHPEEAEVHEEVDRVAREDRLQPVEEAVEARLVRVRVRVGVRVRVRVRVSPLKRP